MLSRQRDRAVIKEMSSAARHIHKYCDYTMTTKQASSLFYANASYQVAKLRTAWPAG